MNSRNTIENGQVWLGIEFGSTRIKAVLIGPDHQPMATGSHTWADSLENGVWTYSLEAVHAGFRDCYRDLKEEVKRLYGATLRKIGGMGVSAMMHGYLAFDAEMRLLTPFRTWRNTITGQAADELTEKMQFNIPQRWSIAHLHQAVLKNEEHLDRLSFFTTLAGYIYFSDLESNNPVAIQAMHLAIGAVCAYLGAIVLTVIVGFKRTHKA